MLAFSADLLRCRFANTASSPCQTGERWPDADASLAQAAVLIPLVVRESGMTVLLTQRTAHLRDHAGQVSFPGGRREPDDTGPVAAALREAAEEVGIDPGQVEVLGALPPYATGTGFRVTPVVGLITLPLNLKLDDFEVAETFEVPLGFLLDPSNRQRHTAEFHGRLVEYWAMPWQGYYIWGATAGMLVRLADFLSSAG